MHVSIRTYRVGRGSIDDVMHRVDRDLADAFAQEDGFIAYHVAQTGERTVASITMFAGRAQAEASNELAAQWVAESLTDFDVERMGVIGGEVMVSRAVADLLEPAHH
jgi:quinol monooxygenase YgiN